VLTADRFLKRKLGEHVGLRAEFESLKRDSNEDLARSSVTNLPVIEVGIALKNEFLKVKVQ